MRLRRICCLLEKKRVKISWVNHNIGRYDRQNWFSRKAWQCQHNLTNTPYYAFCLLVERNFIPFREPVSSAPLTDGIRSRLKTE